MPLQVAYFLVAGWGHYLYRVLPQVQVDRRARHRDRLPGALDRSVCSDSRLVVPAEERFARAERCGCSPMARALDRLADRRGCAHVRRWASRPWASRIRSAGCFFPRRSCSSATAVRARRHGGRSRRTISSKSGLALYNYSPDHDSFPPAATFDRLGLPLYGWQAMILPFMDQTQIYDQIDFRVALGRSSQCRALSDHGHDLSAAGNPSGEGRRRVRPEPLRRQRRDARWRRSDRPAQT